MKRLLVAKCGNSDMVVSDGLLERQLDYGCDQASVRLGIKLLSCMHFFNWSV